MMTVHELRIWPPYFDDLRNGDKRFEVRFNDRHFRVGDEITFREWVPDQKNYTGRHLCMRVRYVLKPTPDCGLVAGYVVLDLEPVTEAA
jgi:hypothetical protein